MLFRLRYVVFFSFFCLASWMGWGLYGYFFDAKKPMIVVTGLEDNNCYAADITCRLTMSKPGKLSIYLDEKPLVNAMNIHGKELEYSFIIPKTIANGSHTLAVNFIDNTFRRNKTKLNKHFIIDNTPLDVSFISGEKNYTVLQGRTLHIQFNVNKYIKLAQVNALAGIYKCFPESRNSSIYECFIPIDCEEIPNDYHFSVHVEDLVGNITQLDSKFQIVASPFKKQTIHVETEKIKAEKAIGSPMANLEKALQDLACTSVQEKLWKGEFCTPIDVIRTTCDFGTVRTTQEKGRYIHKAVDIINNPKTVVWATQDGIIALKERYEVSGNTVVIDHGMGLVSLFFHLDDFSDIKVGEKIAKGNPIGTLGKTGYATGYHLHWEMRMNNVAIDPFQWTQSTF